MKHEQEGKWIYGSSDEVFHPSDYYDTKEEAIEAGKVDFEFEGKYNSFYVGQVYGIDFALHVDVDSILENISQSVYDEVGEVADDYLCHVKKEHLQLLENDVNMVVRQWMDNFGYNPTFFKVDNIERVEGNTF